MEQPNLNYIEELSGGDQAFQQKLIAIIKEELPQEIEEYQNNMINNNLLQAAENVHKLKHKFGIMGLDQSYDLAIIYEEELKKELKQSKLAFEAALGIILYFVNKL